MSQKLDYKKPPLIIRFIFVAEQKPVMGDYFLREDGTMYLWNFKDPAGRVHPVYRLEESGS